MHETKGAWPHLIKPHRVNGQSLAFRNATTSDAEFILSLRLDSAKNRYLSATNPSVDEQIIWLERYENDKSQVYFIIMEAANDTPLGTVRLYNAVANSFEWGSWILADGAPRMAAIESTLMVYAFALACGFERSHFEVRKGNVKVWQYHERLGAIRVRESADDIFYEMPRHQIKEFLGKFKQQLPRGIEILW